jgi:hypothetical protein
MALRGIRHPHTPSCLLAMPVTRLSG